MGVLGYLGDMYGKKKNKPQLFEHTPQGKFLKDMSKTGIYSPEVKRNLMGRMGSEMGGVASRRKAQSRGYLQSRGMTNNMGGTSIAAARLMDAPDRDTQRTMGRESLRIDTENEMSKVKAGEALAAGKNKSREQKQAWQADFYSSAGRGIDEMGEDVAMAMMTGGMSEIPKTMALGGDKYMQMKQYQNDEDYLLGLEKEYNELKEMINNRGRLGGGGVQDSEEVWGSGGYDGYNFQ